jgi:hypothetical protein
MQCSAALTLSLVVARNAKFHDGLLHIAMLFECRQALVSKAMAVFLSYLRGTATGD